MSAPPTGGSGFWSSVGIATFSTLAAGVGTLLIPKVASGAKKVRAALPGGKPIDQLTTDLTQAASDGSIRPAFGRNDEIERLAAAAYDRMVVLTGDPGVGKTAVVEKFACMIVRGQIPIYRGYKVVQLCLRKVTPDSSLFSLVNNILTGGGETQIKEIFEDLIRRVQNGEKIILFIDELQVLVQKYPTIFTGFLEAMARGELPVIGASMERVLIHDWISTQQGMSRRIEEIVIPELKPGETVELLKEGRVSLIDQRVRTQHPRLTFQIDDSAINAVVFLSGHILRNLVNPDRPLKLLREVAIIAINETLRGDRTEVVITYLIVTNYIRLHFSDNYNAVQAANIFDQREQQSVQASHADAQRRDFIQTHFPFANGTALCTELQPINEARALLWSTFTGCQEARTCFLVGPENFAAEAVDLFFSSSRDSVLVIRCSLRQLCNSSLPDLKRAITEALEEKAKVAQETHRHLILHITDAAALLSCLSPQDPSPEPASARPVAVPQQAEALFNTLATLGSQFGFGQYVQPLQSAVHPSRRPTSSPKSHDLLPFIAQLARTCSVIINLPASSEAECPVQSFKVVIRPPAYFETVQWLQKKYSRDMAEKRAQRAAAEKEVREQNARSEALDLVHSMGNLMPYVTMPSLSYSRIGRNKGSGIFKFPHFSYTGAHLSDQSSKRKSVSSASLLSLAFPVLLEKPVEVEEPDPAWVEKLTFVIQALGIDRHFQGSFVDCCSHLYGQLRDSDRFEDDLGTKVFQMTRSAVQPSAVQTVLRKMEPFVQQQLLLEARDTGLHNSLSSEMSGSLNMLAADTGARALWVQEPSMAQLGFRTLQVVSYLMKHQNKVVVVNRGPLLDKALSEEVRGCYFRLALEGCTADRDEQKIYILMDADDLKTPFIREALEEFLRKNTAAHLIFIGKKEVQVQAPQQSLSIPQLPGALGEIVSTVSSFMSSLEPPQSQISLPETSLFPGARRAAEPWTVMEKAAFVHYHLNQGDVRPSDAAQIIFQRTFLSLLGGRMSFSLTFDEVPAVIASQKVEMSAQNIALDRITLESDAIYDYFARFWGKASANDFKFEIDPALTPWTYRFGRGMSKFVDTILVVVAIPIRFIGGSFMSTIGYFAGSTVWGWAARFILRR